MQVVYAREPFPSSVVKTIFLAGPTPRGASVPSWRPEALTLLHDDLGFDGHVFVPEDRSGKVKFSYEDQIEWEEEGLHRADVILFWIPREMSHMPALTTNDEWGHWKDSGKVVLGVPDEAVRVRYQKLYATKFAVPQARTLKNTLRLALDKLGDGGLRQGGECQVPLFIWRRPDFQDWLQAQRRAGNLLHGARVAWPFFVGPKRDHLFLHALHVDMHVAAEKRNKTNEVVLFRPHTAAVLLYRRTGTLAETEIVLVREFRSPANTWTGMIHELPGGSTSNPADSLCDVALQEVEEETGLKLTADRLTMHTARQVAGTLAAHRSTLFSAELSPAEMTEMRQRSGKILGVPGETERTYVEVSTLGSIQRANLVDWSTLGMIFQVLA